MLQGIVDSLMEFVIALTSTDPVNGQSKTLRGPRNYSPALTPIDTTGVESRERLGVDTANVNLTSIRSTKLSRRHRFRTPNQI